MATTLPFPRLIAVTAFGVLAMSSGSGCSFFVDLDQEFPDIDQMQRAKVPRELRDKPLLLAPKASQPLVVDGLRDDAYDERYTYEFRGEHVGSDNVVRVSAAWTDDHLFVLYEFSDLSLFVFEDTTKPGQKIWDCDCVDFYLDTDRPQGLAGSTRAQLAEGKDVHVVRDIRGRSYHERGSDKVEDLEGEFVSEPMPAGGYAIEFSISRDEFALTPAVGRRYGAHLGSADCDKVGGEQPASKRFSWDVERSDTYRVPSLWGTLELVEK